MAMAHACGALRALREIGGIDPNAARVIIGTSAGSLVGADLRVGRSIEEIMASTSERAPERPVDITKAWRSVPDLARRMIGSMWIMTRTALPVPVRTFEPPRIVQRAFPGSLLMITNRQWAYDRYPPEWPAGELWITAYDVDSARRVVLTRRHPLQPSLPQAAQASCSVPGIYPPVRIGGRRMVDGGTQSVTNLDLAGHTGAAAVIALAPMAYDPSDPPGSVKAMMRVRFTSQVSREADAVRRSGAAVLVLRPGAEELRHHRMNVLSRRGTDAVYAATYEAVARRLESTAARRILTLIHSPPTTGRS